jgi:hypothetical protein
MIPDQAEVVRSLYGAWRLAWLDPSGMGQFNLSVEGFWRSFFAAVLVAPGYALLVAQDLLAREEAVHPIWAVLVETLAYAVGWAAFPVAAIFLTRLLGLSRNYVALIVAANWASVIQIGAFLAVIALGFVLPPLAGLAVMLATGAILFYQWFVIRTTLDTTAGIAIAFVLVDLLLTSAVSFTADSLL